MISLGKAALFLGILLLLVWIGLVAPPWNASRDIIAQQGTQIKIQNNLSFIPFTLSKASVIRGSLTASQDITMFIINSTHADLSPYLPPSEDAFSSGPANSVSLNLSLNAGSYYLVLFGTNPGYSSTGPSVRITQTISLSQS